jgi:hypothetical protein
MPDEPAGGSGLASEVVAEPEKSPLIPLTIVWRADERPWGAVFRLVYHLFCKKYFAVLRKYRRLADRWA